MTAPQRQDHHSSAALFAAPRFSSAGEGMLFDRLSGEMIPCFGCLNPATPSKAGSGWYGTTDGETVRCTICNPSQPERGAA